MRADQNNKFTKGAVISGYLGYSNKTGRICKWQKVNETQWVELWVECTDQPDRHYDFKSIFISE
ncbi:hypothetical protein PQC38_gp004 [Aeromonas phage BUCT695]|uniref:hypothetical protein n=1 Tax=Aeromonas phage BUCT695 TaxID=2908630 RepID=UPI0023295A61|nr:hypothetical protein PQC38_gp004 [Aeromonas phage BUCT695]UIW10480.1 hypothetical protein [Aeromonas phage BUCT695]